MPKIVQKENPVLRKTAERVLVRDITTPHIQKIIRDMSAALATQDDGVAIAAPQIGVSLRIFVVAGKIFAPEWKRGEATPVDGQYPDVAFINPEIIKLSRTKKWLHEGCLSVRPLWGDVFRSTHATLMYYDATGKKIKRGASGLLAHIFQHETDHLNGVLFIDKAKDIREGPPEELND